MFVSWYAIWKSAYQQMPLFQNEIFRNFLQINSVALYNIQKQDELKICSAETKGTDVISMRDPYLFTQSPECTKSVYLLQLPPAIQFRYWATVISWLAVVGSMFMCIGVCLQSICIL